MHGIFNFAKVPAISFTGVVFAKITAIATHKYAFKSSVKSESTPKLTQKEKTLNAVFCSIKTFATPAINATKIAGNAFLKISPWLILHIAPKNNGKAKYITRQKASYLPNDTTQTTNTNKAADFAKALGIEYILQLFVCKLLSIYFHFGYKFKGKIPSK